MDIRIISEKFEETFSDKCSSVKSLDLVSVIIPTYNRKNLVCFAIDSALSQTHENIEIIVVDDGSTDDTLGRLAAYGNRIRVIRQPNQGVCAARNHGISVAKGNFIALLDSDDRWLPWKVAAQIEAFQRFPELQLVCTDLSVIARSGEIMLESCLRKFYPHYNTFPPTEMFSKIEILNCGQNKHAIKIGDFSSLIFMGNFFHLSTVMFPVDVARKLGGFDHNVGNSGEDYEFFSRIAQMGPIGLIDSCATLCAAQGSDNLSLMRTHTALANLATMEKIVQRRRGEIRLPAKLIAERRRASELWAGLALFDDDRLVEARAHLWRGLQMGGCRPRAMLCWLLTYFPLPVVQAIRFAYHKMKRT